MADQLFSDLYLGECEHCGVALEDWDWSTEDMIFRTTCTCGAEVTLEPTSGIVDYEVDDLGEDEEDED